ncbi:MAG: THUMP domain-containing protein, partial [Cyanobacteria bacterium P01_A01_bin.105]
MTSDRWGDLQGFATVARGLETLAAQELEQLGIQGVDPGFCGVSFRGRLADLYRINLWARLPFRVLVQVGRFRCQTADELYQGVQRIDWGPYLTPEHTLAVRATGKTPQLNHTHFTALQVKHAIVDQQRDRTGQRSSVAPRSPDVGVNIHLGKTHAIVSLDSSGSSLHRRGYRPAVGAAPLKESLAAALIYLTDWQPALAFVDPLCGSGTLPIEAGLQARNIAPGLFRDQFGFETWPSFDPVLWQQLGQAAQADQTASLTAPILGSDLDGEVIRQARHNASSSGLGNQVMFSQQDLVDIEAPADTGILLCNPPYGERLGERQELGRLYKQLGDVLKQRFKGWTA